MNTRDFTEACSGQYGACLEMLRRAIEDCPESLWNRKLDEAPFWKQAYHTVAFIDFYISDSPEDFRPELGDSEKLRFENMPEEPFTRESILKYLQAVSARVQDVMNAYLETGFEGENRFPWTGRTFADLLLYNLRHAQHHVGRLHSMLARHAGARPKWVATGRLGPRDVQ